MDSFIDFMAGAACALLGLWILTRGQAANPPKTQPSEYSPRVLKVGPNHRFVLRYPKFLSETATAHLKKSFVEAIESGKTIVLEDGMTFDIVDFDSKEGA